MGSVSSKSPLERRNTVARRSQRRTLHNLKSKVEQLHKDVKKFKGINEDANYIAFKNEIEFFKNDMTRKGKDLQPQVRSLYETVYKRICEVDEALLNKLQENREKQEKKEAKNNENGEVAQSDANGTDIMSYVTSVVPDNETIVQVHRENNEARQLEDNEEKRKTVEIKLVKVTSEGSPQQIRVISPAEKRKSILKVGGVPVMPGALMNELSAQNTRIVRQHEQHYSPALPTKTVQDVVARIDIIIEHLRQIEEQISNFVGKKQGTQYLRIRDTLNRYLIELNSLSPVDDHALDRMKVCRNYIGSCLSFLDEKATVDSKRESFTSDDEVFENNNVPPMNKVEETFKIQRLLKNTAV